MNTLIEAARQALAALEYEAGKGNDNAYEKERVALRKAIANEALNRMAENARELGLDYEPVQAEKQEPVEMPTIKFSQVADGIEVGYDLFGGVDIRLGGEFVYVHINYNYKYTDNATRTHLANSIVELLTNKPQHEWVSLTLDEIWEICKKHDPLQITAYARAIEKALKEKNT